MNSSISSSDLRDTDIADRSADLLADGWTRWLIVFVAALALFAALIFAFVIAVDPYDSGRFGFLGIVGVNDLNTDVAGVSRAHDPQFDSAIFGNSTGQLLKPSALSASTGMHFVQLTTPSIGPREQLAILDFFVRHHPHIGAIVMATDHLWCTRDPRLPPRRPFPFWLYNAGYLEYAGRIFSSHAVEGAWRRIRVGLGWIKRTTPDGYFDYEAMGVRRFVTETPPVDNTPDFDGIVSDEFPAMLRLADVLQKLPPETAVVLVLPPMFHTLLPRPRSRAFAEDAACKRALRRVVAGRTRGGFIDYRIDNAVTRDPANFNDVQHVTGSEARRMERDIAAVIGMR